MARDRSRKPDTADTRPTPDEFVQALTAKQAAFVREYLKALQDPGLGDQGSYTVARARVQACHAHAKRATRVQPLSTPLAETYSSPWDRLTAAALAYADAGDDEEAFAKAKDRLRRAAVSSRGLLVRPESLQFRRRGRRAELASLLCGRKLQPGNIDLVVPTL